MPDPSRPSTERWRASGQADDGFLPVIDAAFDGILVVDAAGRVRFANPAAASVLGRTPGELGELPFGLPLTGGGDLAQLDVRRPDGRHVVVEMHVSPVQWQGEDVLVVTLRDITARVLAERRLALSEERYALSARGVNDGLWDWDAETGLLHTSARLQEMLGRTAVDREEDPEKVLDLVHPEDVDAVQHEIDRHLQGRASRLSRELRVRRADGSWVWVLARGMAVIERGEVRRFAGSLTDISDRKGAEESLRRMALHDPLTGLANRALFLEQLQRALERERRMQIPFAVLFLDLDRFKLVNDSLGHGVGDALLQEVARRLEQCVRSTDTVARLGGDEFAVLLEEPEDVASVLAGVERVQEALAAPVHLGSEVVYPTTSIGVACSSVSPPDAESALRYADIAMYHAKRAGQNRYQVYDPTMHARGSARLRQHQAVREAFEGGQLFPRYMPIVDLDEGRVVGFEALLRWRVSEGEVLDAGAFIDAAEETEVIVPAGWRLLVDACRQVRDWRAEGFPVEMTVNLSDRQLVDGGLPEKVATTLEELDLEGRAVGLEITERTAMAQAEGAVEQMDRLRELGMGILIDDFGTGYSSLAAIQQMPVTAVKIDRAFTRSLQEPGSSGDIIAAILAIAESLHLQVVAEGVETPRQRERLTELGCLRGQGYLFGRALDADAATALLRRQEDARRRRVGSP